MQTVAVTGASGHIGANLVRELIGRGYEVVALVRQSSRALDGLEVNRVRGDLEDLDSLRKAFVGVQQVYHMAAYISIQSGEQEKLQSINVEGTRNVIQACQAEGVSTLVHFSSIHALNQHPLDRAVTEDNPLVAARKTRGGDYEYSKAQADRLVRECDGTTLSTRIIYPSAVIGPNDFELSLTGQAILKMANGQLPALVSGGYDWVDARDVSFAAVEAAEKGAHGDRYILSGHYLSISDMAAVIAELTGTAAPRITVPIWLAKLFIPLMGVWAKLQGETPLYTRDSLSVLCSNKDISHARATEKLGYQPRDFRSAMQDTLLDYSKNNRLKVNLHGD
jgi:dihydroflavonol-4-reductase